jgi:hypothetical protein
MIHPSPKKLKVGTGWPGSASICFASTPKLVLVMCAADRSPFEKQ